MSTRMEQIVDVVARNYIESMQTPVPEDLYERVEALVSILSDLRTSLSRVWTDEEMRRYLDTIEDALGLTGTSP